MNTKIDLDQRIAAALGEGIQSLTIAGVLAEAEQAASLARQAYDLAKAHALSPLTLIPEVSEARQQMADASFMQERMQEAIAHLQAALGAALEHEAANRAAAAYQAAIIERDSVAKELAEEFPGLADRMADILTRLETSNRQMAKASEGMADRRGAEEVARPVIPGQNAGPSLMDQVVLPTFDRGNVLLWPPRHRTPTHRFMDLGVH